MIAGQRGGKTFGDFSPPLSMGEADRLQSSGAFKVGAKPATDANARIKSSGKSFPRRAARRRIPAQAKGLK